MKSNLKFLCKIFLLLMIIILSMFFISNNSIHSTLENDIKKDNVIGTSDIKSNSQIIEDLLEGWIEKSGPQRLGSQA